MSASASIDISTTEVLDYPQFVVDTLDGLHLLGWKPQKPAMVLPLGDDGLYEWEAQELSWVEILGLAGEKAAVGEMVGVVLLAGQGEVGCDVLISNDGRVSFGLSINRVGTEIEGLCVPDFEWYLKQILPAFLGQPGEFSGLTFNFHR